MVAFEAWNGASINTIVGGADLQELPLPVLLGVAVVLAAAPLVAIARWRPQWIGAALPLALALMFVVAWLLLDARWQWNLARQVAATARTYGGKDWREKHLAAEDGPLFEFIEKVRAKLPPTPVRVFMVADAHYFRGRGAYHLYPHNVLLQSVRTNVVPPSSALQLGRLPRRLPASRHPVRCRARRCCAGTAAPPIAAEPLVVEPGAALFRIR